MRSEDRPTDRCEKVGLIHPKMTAPTASVIQPMAMHCIELRHEVKNISIKLISVSNFRIHRFRTVFLYVLSCFRQASHKSPPVTVLEG